MSGLLALLDDVAGIAKVAAASVDDIAGQAARAGVKAAGAVIDDAAVTPRYVQGFAPARELPVVGRIALGSIRNKLVILLPAALLLTAFAPWAITPLLMLGGAYLCFEGAEKVWHLIHPHPETGTAAGSGDAPVDPAHLEREKVAGAIKTDFILSAEIMTIVLAALPPDQPLWAVALALGLAGVGITVAVYGGVALIVKADDLGLWLARRGRSGAVRGLGRGIVRVMPGFLRVLTLVGTAAMIWVGGSILIHGLDALGWHAPYAQVHHLAATVAAPVAGAATAVVEWVVTAALDGVAGLLLGLALIPLVTRVINPAIRALRGAG